MKINIIDRHPADCKYKLTKQERIYFSVLEDSQDFENSIKEIREALGVPNKGLTYNQDNLPEIITDAFETIKNHPQVSEIINSISYPKIGGTSNNKIDKKTSKYNSERLWMSSYMMANAVCDLFRLNRRRWSDPILFLIFFNDLIINTSYGTKIEIVKGSQLYEYFTDPKLIKIFNYSPNADTDIYLHIKGPFTGVSEFIEEVSKMWTSINGKLKSDRPSVPFVNKPTIHTMQKIFRDVNAGKSYEEIAKDIRDNAPESSRFDGIGTENARQMYKRYRELINSLPIKKVKSLLGALDMNMMLR